MKRITTRFNDVEETELELLKKTYHVDDDSKAIKLAINWVNNYLKNVTAMFFPSNYDLVLVRKKKTEKIGRKVY